MLTYLNLTSEFIFILPALFTNTFKISKISTKFARCARSDARSAAEIFLGPSPRLATRSDAVLCRLQHASFVWMHDSNVVASSQLHYDVCK